MKFQISHLNTVLISVFLLITPSILLAENDRLTLIQLSDLHGNLRSHAGELIYPDGSKRYTSQAGGLARIKTVVDDIRQENPQSLLLAVGDTVHGGAEVLFTVGDAIMPALNAFGIDVFTPGNWDFAYGGSVFRNRFSQFGPKPPLTANSQIMANAYDGPGVTAANFPSVAINLYNDAPLPQALRGQRVLAPYKIFQVKDTRIAVIGITAAIVPQQSPAFNLGFRFTQGVEELPGIIKEVQQQGSDLIVVQSELGLAQNIEIGRAFEEIDVVFSAHTHEVTVGAILADKKGMLYVPPGEDQSPKVLRRLRKGAAIVVEAGEDLYLGRLDIRLRGNRIQQFNWRAIPIDETIAENPEIKALVDHAEEPFVAGKDGKIERHSLIPGGYCPNAGCDPLLVPQIGHQLVEDLDTVVGHTEVLLQRHSIMEGVMNNFIADSVKSVTEPVVASQTTWSGVDMSMTNGFRFDTPILSAQELSSDAVFTDGRQIGDITLRDLYSYFPVGAAVVVGEFSGSVIEQNLEDILSSVFNPNPFLQHGGWYLGLSNNLRQEIDIVNRPFSSSQGRIVRTLINGEALDTSKRYVFASCYGHGFPVGRVCRVNGGSNSQFFAIADLDDYQSGISLKPPKITSGVVAGRDVRQVAPDKFLHPVHIMRRFLDGLAGNTINASQFALGRVKLVDSLKENNPEMIDVFKENLPYIVQPVQGMGPRWQRGLLGNK